VNIGTFPQVTEGEECLTEVDQQLQTGGVIARQQRGGPFQQVRCGGQVAASQRPSAGGRQVLGPPAADALPVLVHRTELSPDQVGLLQVVSADLLILHDPLGSHALSCAAPAVSTTTAEPPELLDPARRAHGP